jgi:hypothetical protein
VVVGEGEKRSQRCCALTFATQFMQFGIDQKAEPESMKRMVNKSDSTIKDAKFDDVIVEEEEERTN